MADKQDYSRIVISSIKDKASGGYNISSYDKDINAFIKAIKSALPKDAFLSVGDKELSKQGKLKLEIYTHSDDANVVKKSLEEKAQKMQYTGSGGQIGDDKYKITRSRTIPDSTVESLRKEEAESINKEHRNEGEKTRKEYRHGALKTLGALVTLADITRRILSAILSFSTQVVRDNTTAHNLGMSYSSFRELSNLETAHGITKGTFAGAMSDLQTKFGNITNLDESALSALAVVMGSDIRELVESGMGGSNPEQLMGKILDAFNARANSGYNSIGQYVGEEQARRELYSYLNRISPQIAELFAVMQEERNNINSIYRKQADTFDEWRKLFEGNRGGFTTADYGVVETLGQYTNQIKGIVEQIKQGVMIKVAPTLIEALGKIAGINIGLSGDQKLEQSRRYRSENEQNLATINKMLESLPEESSISDPKQRFYLQARKNALIRAKKGIEEANAHTDLKGVPLAPFGESIFEAYSSQYVNKQMVEYVATNSMPDFAYQEAINEQYDKEVIDKWVDIYIKSIKRAIIKKRFGITQIKEEKEALKEAGLSTPEEAGIKKFEWIDVSKDFLDATEEEIIAEAWRNAYRKLGYDADKREIEKYIRKVFMGSATGRGRYEIEAQSSKWAVGSFIEGENINWQKFAEANAKELMNESTVLGYTANIGGEKRFVLAIDIDNNGEISEREVVYSVSGIDFGDKTMQVGTLNIENGKANFINAMQTNASEQGK